MEHKHKIKHTPVTIYVNYLIIISILFYAGFLVFYIFSFKPELKASSVSLMFLPVFFDWLIGLATILSFKGLEQLRLIDHSRRLSIENVFFLIMMNTFVIAAFLFLYDLVFPDFFMPEPLVLMIFPLLLLKNVWFVLQYNPDFLKKSYTLSASGFMILLAVLSAIIILIDGFFKKNPVLGSLFDYIVFFSSVGYFLFNAAFSYAYMRKKRQMSQGKGH